MINRNKAVDVTRGISILAIILGHLGVWSIIRVVFTFHVPIFYIVTGYYSKVGDVLPFVKKKARDLLLPYIITCVCIISLSGLIASIFGGHVLDTMKGWVWASLYGAGDSYTEPIQIKAIGAIWFLWASFWGSTFFHITLRWKPVQRATCVAGLFAIGYVTSRLIFWFPLSIQAGCCATLFIYMGYCLRQKIEVLRRLSKTIVVTGSAVAMVLWLSFIVSFKSFWLVHNNFGAGAVDVIRSLCACYCVFLIALFIDAAFPLLAGGLAYLGRNSLVVLCVHITELNLINWRALAKHMAGMGIPFLFSGGIAFVTKIILIVSMTHLIVMIKKRLFISEELLR